MSERQERRASAAELVEALANVRKVYLLVEEAMKTLIRLQIRVDALEKLHETKEALVP